MDSVFTEFHHHHHRSHQIIRWPALLLISPPLPNSKGSFMNKSITDAPDFVPSGTIVLWNLALIVKVVQVL
ncbi:hypothetical protein F0562_016825 [Nyssa sinensis]|uniref:Uncharacterized protein n=1 Tax=Nyssa sinensis TaxID=561372 RepID=A0A5J4ZF87_9ASTE|nr:hypothetical protein F0562_016825 [Nyssa sinensis]